MTESYTSPNGTLVTREGPFVLDGFRAERTTRKGGALGLDSETVWLTTLDGKRTVGLWSRDNSFVGGGLVCHYRDRGDDTLHGVTLDELVAYARKRWPHR